MSRHWTALPNFVDCAVFRPVASFAEKQAIRQSLGIPADVFVVGCVAAVKKHHKRIDYLINEFACLSNDTVVPGREEFEQKHAKNAKGGDSYAFGEPAGGSGSRKITPADAAYSPHLPSRTSPPALSLSKGASVQISSQEPYLLIAGAKTDETAELLALAESLIPGRYKIMTDCSRAQMPDFLRSMDVFVLASLFEMMPIALLEALATGLPCVVNAHPVLEWMTGVEEEKSIEQKETKETKEGGLVFASGGNNNPSLFPSFPFVQTGGEAIDMSLEGSLAAALAGLTPEWLALHGHQARERAVTLFSTEAVIGQYVKYYGEVWGETLDHRR